MKKDTLESLRFYHPYNVVTLKQHTEVVHDKLLKRSPYSLFRSNYFRLVILWILKVSYKRAFLRSTVAVGKCWKNWESLKLKLELNWGSSLSCHRFLFNLPKCQQEAKAQFLNQLHCWSPSLSFSLSVLGEPTPGSRLMAVGSYLPITMPELSVPASGSASDEMKDLFVEFINWNLFHPEEAEIWGEYMERARGLPGRVDYYYYF